MLLALVYFFLCLSTNLHKKCKKKNRSVGRIRCKAVVGASKINQCGALLSDGDNKMELIRFLLNRWRTNSSVQV